MTFFDKAKATAERAREQAAHGLEAGRVRLDEVQARRQYGRLLQKLGDAYYAEHCGEGNREAVVGVLGELERYGREHPGATPAQPQAVRRARDIMHPGAECLTEDDTLATAAGRMRDLGVGSLPICGADDRLHGIITDRDIVVRCIAEGREPAQMRAADLAQGTVYWVDAAADVDEVVREMEEHRIKRLPVIDNHRLVGLISEADLARHLSEDRLAEFVEKVFGEA
jgi:CBS domain-containing protein